MYEKTTATRKVTQLKKRIRAVQGGTSASKTISILLCLIDFSQSDEVQTLTSIVSESVPHLKRGAIRDFKNIMKSHNYWRDSRWNSTDSIYTFETGSQIEFFSSDNGDKLRGARRDRLFINEANNVAFDAFEQLEVRTKEFVFLDWNPTNEFWFYSEILGKREDVDHLILTYLDNEALDVSIVESIEQRKNRPGWWQVYGLGQLGEVEGKIYKGWQIIDEVPAEARLIRRGLDFGYSIDPTVLEDIYSWNGAFVIDEQLYQKGQSNKNIADFILNLEDPDRLVVGDSAEPKSIDEIRSYGVNIIGATKGPGSVYQGIQYVQDQKIFITKRSVKTIKAYRNYLFVIDKNGKIINEPDDSIHEWSNPMDAIRYGFNSIYKAKENTQEKDYEKAARRFISSGQERKVMSSSPSYRQKYEEYEDAALDFISSI